MNSVDSALKTALITDGSGFCARHLAKRLCDEGGTQIIGADWAEPADEGWVLDDFARVDFVMFGSYAKARAAFGFEPATLLRDALREFWIASIAGCF